MKQDYTLDELQTEMTALAQLFDSVTLADPRMHGSAGPGYFAAAE